MENDITREDFLGQIDESIKSISSNMSRLNFAMDIIKSNVDKYDKINLAIIEAPLSYIDRIMFNSLPEIEEAVGYSYKDNENK